MTETDPDGANELNSDETDSRENTDDGPKTNAWFLSPRGQRIANKFANSHNEDVILYNGEIRDCDADDFIAACDERDKRPKAHLILVTNGGITDAAYRIAVALQDHYRHGFRLFVPGVCKSAGTLIAVGATDLSFGRLGQLGPLDVQLGIGGSGLEVSDSLKALNDIALGAFEKFYNGLVDDYEDLPAHTAMDIARDLTVGLYAPVFARVDPIYVGISHRALLVARDYGKRLLKRGHNIDEYKLDLLIWEYVAHNFVINWRDGIDLFKDVYGPPSLLVSLAEELGTFALEEKEPLKDIPPFAFLSDPPSE